MPTVRPISDLRNKAKEISAWVHRTGEPLFITREGRGDMVVMSLGAWEREQARVDLYRLLEDAEREVRAGDRGISVKTLRKHLKR